MKKKKKHMKTNKKQISIINRIIICLIVIIPVAIGTFAVHRLSPQQNTPPGQTFVPVDNSVVKYDPTDVKTLYQREQNRQILSAEDETIKNTLSKKHSPLTVTDDYTVTYNRSTDLFQAQITTVSVDTAKREADQWFFDQGMSVEAPCELPLSFSLDNSIATSLKGVDFVFSPLPPGC